MIQHRIGEIPAFWPTAFVAFTLGALAILPIVQDQRISRIEEDLLVLEEARDSTRAYVTVLVDEILEGQRRVVTGQPGAGDRSRRERGDAILADLNRIVLGAELEGFDVTGLLARLRTEQTAWYLMRAVPVGLDPREQPDPIVRQTRELVAANRVKSLALELQREVEAAVARARGRVARTRATRNAWTVGLALLAIGATLALGVIGRRLRALVAEAQSRRRESLRARREMQAVLEASADGVLSVDLEGRCTSLNSTGSRLLGYPEIDAQGRDLHDLLHGSNGDGAHDADDCPALVALRSGQIEREANDLLTRRDGSTFPARWHLRPLKDGRETRGGVITITDMTDVREAERRLRAAVRAREEVVAVVSHDLRNPLGTVMGAAELIEEFELPIDKVKGHARSIRDAGGRMKRLIQDLLDVAKIEAGRFSVEPRPVAVEELLEVAVAPFLTDAEREELTLSWGAEPGLTPVLADRDRFVQLFSNLLGNALKFTPAGGSVRVDASCAGEQGVGFTVTDTGSGIEPDHLEHLFDRFWQAEGTDSRGTGLGLAIAYGIVEAHGGGIRVESEVGKGTTVHVTLPAAEGEAAAR